MSRAALLSLMLLIASITALYVAPQELQWLTTTAATLLFLSSLSLLIALLVGKRVKFDPVLR